jgi:hypothetical protein
MEKEQHSRRRNAVKGALFMTADTPLAPTLYERQLLAKYVRGVLSLEQVLALLEQQSAD